MQLPDLAEERQAGLHRWYLRRLQALKLDRSKTRCVSEFELQRFSEFKKKDACTVTLPKSLGHGFRDQRG
jgi:hypothetical protein